MALGINEYGQTVRVPKVRMVEIVTTVLKGSGEVISSVRSQWPEPLANLIVSKVSEERLPHQNVLVTMHDLPQEV